VEKSAMPASSVAATATIAWNYPKPVSFHAARNAIIPSSTGLSVREPP